MLLLADFAVLVVAAMHVLFMILEMYLWNKPVGQKVLRMQPEYASNTRILAANQGLYNGFLAAGLVWSLITDQFAFNLQLFFLSCVIIAGVYAGFTVKRTIFWIQALPAIIALLLVFLAQSYI